MDMRSFSCAGALGLLLSTAPAVSQAEGVEFFFSGTAIANLSEDTRTGGATGPSNVPDSLASFLVDGSTVLSYFVINPDRPGFVLPSGIANGGTQYLLDDSKIQFGSLTHSGGPSCDAFFADCSLVVFNNSDGPIAGMQIDRLLLPSFRHFAESQPSDISYLLAQFVIEDLELSVPGAPPPDLYASDQLSSVLPTLDSTRRGNNLSYRLIYFGRTVSGADFRRTFDLQDVSFGPTAAVPEPSTWAMGLAGLALVSWAVRRQRAPHNRR